MAKLVYKHMAKKRKSNRTSEEERRKFRRVMSSHLNASRKVDP